ncbi:MAG: ABC transporter ATP-binding protein [Alphaproteobacteria bacterium]|nr:ABC transporter ATP-binding protein [Alphaproteobacteria bacterium]
MTATIEVKKLCKNFDNLQAVADISFSTAKGEIIALLGPNGAGKSTLMNMITGYLAPSDGEIFILGKNIKNHPLAAKTAIGFLSEGSPLYPDMTVAAFLNYMAELRGFSGKKKEERLQAVCKTANIENVLTQRIETLSKGYLRRVGFAQSIISDPQILLLDEPTDGLDPNQKEHIRSLIKQMGQNKTIIISTHLLEEAENISTRIILINKGKIMADGSLQDVLRQTHSRCLENAFKKLTISEND